MNNGKDSRDDSVWPDTHAFAFVSDVLNVPPSRNMTIQPSCHGYVRSLTIIKLQGLSIMLRQQERETEHTECPATNFLNSCQAKLPNLKGFGVRPYGPSGLAMSEKAALNSFQLIIISGCILNGLAPFQLNLVLPSSEFYQQTSTQRFVHPRVLRHKYSRYTNQRQDIWTTVLRSPPPSSLG